MSELVGILNYTPDSFSDGGETFTLDAALRRIAQMQEQGASVIDIGAESTRQGARALSAEEEWERLAPLLREVRSVMVSLDTRHPANASRALELGVTWINDVSGGDCALALRGHPQAKYVLMHSLSVPADRAVTLPESCDPVEVVLAFFVAKMAALELSRQQIILDPGIGFGKTAEQSLQLIRRAGELKILGFPLLFGHSRKSCFSSIGSFESPFQVSARREAAEGQAPQQNIKERDGATLVSSLHLARQGIDYLRVHNVGLHAQAFAVEKLLHV